MPPLSLHQQLTQEQVLAPQMRRSLELLQATSLELEQVLSQALETNPVLEESPQSTSLDELLDSQQTDPERTDDWLESYVDDQREWAILENRNTHSSPEDQELRDHLWNSLVEPRSLPTHLLDQLAALAPPPNLRSALEILIGSLDERGLLTESLPTLATQHELEPRALQDALTLLQSLDPPGIGARDLRECLLLQLQAQGREHTLEARLVRDHLDDLARNHLPKIARQLTCDLDTLEAAVHRISQLSLNPGAAFQGSQNPHLQPDLRFQRNNHGQWEVEPTGSYLPKIRLNEHYKDLMAQASTPRSTRTYLRQQLRDGRQLLKALDQRQETILAVAREIAVHQKPFLEKGPRHLRPLTMQEVAQPLGIHPTTVSRAVAGKYADTPWGLYELRRFFSSGYHTQEGQQVANQSVRQALQELIAQEDPQKPLSDTKLAALLQEQGLQVARRTVAKYRDQLGLLPSHLRRKHTNSTS